MEYRCYKKGIFLVGVVKLQITWSKLPTNEQVHAVFLLVSVK